ncbi:MAG: hypothetical protein M3O31_15490 [Acidobacteriota bacterium]|nr:hypothetical protein [Acidobacteriota bacterium]
MNTIRATIANRDAEDNSLIINHLEYLSIVERPTVALRKSTQTTGSSNIRLTILLLDADEDHRNSLEASLRNVRYEVLAYEPSYLKQYEDLSLLLETVGLIIFDVTVASREIWQQLIRVCRYRAPHGMPVPVICPTRVDRGPGFEQYLERLEAQLIYEN